MYIDDIPEGEYKSIPPECDNVGSVLASVSAIHNDKYLVSQMETRAQLTSLASATGTLTISAGNCLLGKDDSVGDGESDCEDMLMEETPETMPTHDGDDKIEFPDENESPCLSIDDNNVEVEIDTLINNEGEG